MFDSILISCPVCHKEWLLKEGFCGFIDCFCGNRLEFGINKVANPMHSLLVGEYSKQSEEDRAMEKLSEDDCAFVNYLLLRKKYWEKAPNILQKIDSIDLIPEDLFFIQYYNNLRSRLSDEEAEALRLRL